MSRFDPGLAQGVPAGQGELFDSWRYRAVFTDSTLGMLDAESAHRDHAIVEQVIAELKDGPLAQLPSGRSSANGAWTVLASIAFNLTRAACTRASRRHARARLATIRTHLITVPARIATTARRRHLHLPRDLPWATAWAALFTAALPPPAPTRTCPHRPRRAQGNTPRGRALQTGQTPTPISTNSHHKANQNTPKRPTVDPG